MIAVTFAVVEDPAVDFPTLIDQALAELEAGFTL